MPNIYFGRLPKAYGISMCAQRCANTLNHLKQVFSFGNESKTTALTKSKLSGRVLSCLAMFNDILSRGLCKKESRQKAQN